MNMNRSKQKKLLITFCVFLLLWNFPLIGLFESRTAGAASLWVMGGMFVSWGLIIFLLWRIVHFADTDNPKTEGGE